MPLSEAPPHYSINPWNNVGRRRAGATAPIRSALGDGRALAVDADRDLRAPYAVAERRGPHVAFAADTHPHAGFLSGAVRLGHDAGATGLVSAAGRRAFAHTPPADGDEVDLGGLTLRALTTPAAPTSTCRTSSWTAAPNSACSPVGHRPWAPPPGPTSSAPGRRAADEHPTWRANAPRTYRFWRDVGHAAGALVAGVLATPSA